MAIKCKVCHYIMVCLYIINCIACIASSTNLTAVLRPVDKVVACSWCCRKSSRAVAVDCTTSADCTACARISRNSYGRSIHPYNNRLGFGFTSQHRLINIRCNDGIAVASMASFVAASGGRHALCASIYLHI